MSRAPRIGIAAPEVTASWGPWHGGALVVPSGYLRAVHDAGGVSLALAPGQPAGPDDILGLLDGLLLIGGTDVDPRTYGAASHAQTDAPAPDRDAFEVALTRGALARDLPLLAVCRGMQILNVACGGTLIQHLPDHLGATGHRRTLGSFVDADHTVRLASRSGAAAAAGEQVHRVKSHHHQAVDVLGTGLTVTGWAADDELPEAIEFASNRFALGVQWHPEEDPDSQVIAAFVAASRDATR